MNNTIQQLMLMPHENEAQTRQKQLLIDAFMSTPDFNWLLPAQRRAIRRMRLGLDYVRSSYHAFETGEIEPITAIHK